MKAVFAAVLALSLAACAAPPQRGTFVETVNAGPGGRACYRTLGRVDCHAQPLPGETARRVGFFDWAALKVPD